jgi:hypothetical protein
MGHRRRRRTGCLRVLLFRRKLAGSDPAIALAGNVESERGVLEPIADRVGDDRIADPAISRQVSFDVIFAPRLSELNTGDASSQRELITGIAERIAVELVRAGSSGKTHEQLNIPGIADIRFFPDRPSYQRGVGGIEVSPHPKMRKILQNAVETGAKQLRARGESGVVIVRSDFVPLPDIVDVVLSARSGGAPRDACASHGHGDSRNL